MQETKDGFFAHLAIEDELWPPASGRLPPLTTTELGRREVNNGMLILEDVPKISRDVTRCLNCQQDVRAARFRAWTPDGADT